jgi:hypothetical protein
MLRLIALARPSRAQVEPNAYADHRDRYIDLQKLAGGQLATTFQESY